MEGLNYVVKYVHKKDLYLSSIRFEMLNDYLRIFPRCLDDYSSRYPKMTEYIKTLRNYFPHVHSSYYLGISVLDEFKYLDAESTAKLIIDDKPLSIVGVPRKFGIPAYIVNRLMYDMDDFDNTLRKLSPIGLKVVSFRLDRRIEEFANYVGKVRNEYFALLTSDDKVSLRKKFLILVFFLAMSYFCVILQFISISFAMLNVLVI